MVEEKIVNFQTFVRTFNNTSRAPKLRQPILLSDSKGYTLERHCPHKEFPQFVLWCKRGARSKDLVDIASRKIGPALRRFRHITIYVWIGTCDITERTDDNPPKIKLRYETESDCLSEISTQYKRLIDIVNSYEGAVLKFVELPMICTQAYNKSQGNAESLSVDKKISGWVRSINLYIRELNRDLNQNTLHFSADCVRNRKGSDLQPRYSVKASVLEDGVHPTQLTSLLWVKKLLIDAKKHCYGADPSDELELMVPADELELL